MCVKMKLISRPHKSFLRKSLAYWIVFKIVITTDRFGLQKTETEPTFDQLSGFRAALLKDRTIT